jgi:hypothetical protein
MTVSTPASRERHRRVHAAVVELDALPDAVRASTEHDDLGLAVDFAVSLRDSYVE